MAVTVIGRVKSGQGKSYEVKWDQASRDVYVSWPRAGWSQVGKASSAGAYQKRRNLLIRDAQDLPS